jgi:hypothetical protein
LRSRARASKGGRASLRMLEPSLTGGLGCAPHGANAAVLGRLRAR